MKNLFNSIMLMKPKKNLFDLTHDVKLSCKMGDLIPIMCMDVVPGDKVKLSGQSLIRLAPMVAPVMHRMNVTMHYFFVPNRILWDNWEKYITNTKLDSGALPAHPFLTYDNTWNDPAVGIRLANYLGLPSLAAVDYENPEPVNALPFAAYQCIWNEYYRDQNLYPEIDFKLVDGENDIDILPRLRKRAWKHDYFTSCLPFAQKGDSVDIPLGNVVLANNEKEQFFVAEDGSSPVGQVVANGLTPNIGVGPAGGPYVKANLDPNGSLEVEPTTINDLRRAFKLQEWLERNARGGTRYIESILSHFGVKSSDKRLQRPEYITGSKSPIVISEVLNTTGGFDLPQGNMSGHGVSVNTGNFGSYYAEEHGYILGLMSIMPEPAYYQGIPKHFLRIDDPTQYYWPSFAHIGEQEVLRKELYAFKSGGNQTFGYIPRYSEYKYLPSRVAGDFVSSLDYWHLARKFDAVPVLNSEFVECNPSKRIFAVTDENVDDCYCQVLNVVKAVRPMPKFSTPQF